MEHRIGQRHLTDVKVYIGTSGGRVVSEGVLADVSISGGFIRTALLAEPLSAVTVQFRADDPTMPAMMAQVVRRTPQGLGIAWEDYATKLVRSLTRLPISDLATQASMC
jgi:PilZ domain